MHMVRIFVRLRGRLFLVGNVVANTDRELNLYQSQRVLCQDEPLRLGLDEVF